MSQMLTNNQPTRTSKPATAALAISWPVACAGVPSGVAGCGGRMLASVCWKVDGGMAYPTGVDVDGHEYSLGEGAAVRTVQLGDLVHMDTAGGELHLTLRTEADGTKRVLFVATGLLEALQIPGGRAEWPVLVAG